MENNINLHKAFESFLKEDIMKTDLTKYITYDVKNDTLTIDMKFNYTMDAFSLIDYKNK